MARCTTMEIVHHALVTTYKEDLTVAMAAAALAVPVTHPIVLKTTGAGAEALTLANGIPGQTLIVNLVTDGGGDGTLTPANATGFTNVVLADAGDQVVLLYIDDTVGWVLISATGAAGPPVITP